MTRANGTAARQSARREKIAELFAQGHDHFAIAEMIGGKPGDIRHALRRAKLVKPLAHGRPKAKPVTPIVDEHDRNWRPMCEIANEQFLAALNDYFDKHRRRAA